MVARLNGLLNRIIAEQAAYRRCLLPRSTRSYFREVHQSARLRLSRFAWVAPKVGKGHTKGNRLTFRCRNVIRQPIFDRQANSNTTVDGEGKALSSIRPTVEALTSPQFSAPNALRLEVSEAFTSAKPCYLNKPLIKILEDLGAPTSAFLALQRRAVQAIEAQVQTIATLPKMLHQYSLGTVYGVLSAIRCLSGLNLTLEDLPRGIQDYLHDCINFAKATLLRNIKFRGRIALPGCVTLVGGVDESRSLKEGQVFICIERTSGRRRVTHEYIQGPVVVTKSPTTHPGDIRVLTAIGKPTTSFLRAQKNTIVFSAHGARAEPSTMSGSDIDGTYVCVCTFGSGFQALTGLKSMS